METHAFVQGMIAKPARTSSLYARSDRVYRSARAGLNGDACVCPGYNQQNPPVHLVYMPGAIAFINPHEGGFEWRRMRLSRV
jgi:hypothetical protein